MIKLWKELDFSYESSNRFILFYQKNIFSNIYRFENYIKIQYFDLENNHYMSFKINENESDCYYTASYAINEDFIFMYYDFNIHVFKINDKKLDFLYEINLYDNFIIDFEGKDSPYASPIMSFLDKDRLLIVLNRESENSSLILFNFINKEFEYIFNYNWRYENHIILGNEKLFLIYYSEWKNQSNKILILDLKSKTYKELKTFIGSQDIISDASISKDFNTLLYCENYDSMIPTITKLDLTNNISKKIEFNYNIRTTKIFFSKNQTRILTCEINENRERKLKIWDLDLSFIEEYTLGKGKFIFNNDSNKCILLNEDKVSVFEINI